MAVTGTTITKAGSTANTAELRSIGSQFSAAIASAQMTKTTDTGQIDWTTITWAAGAQTWGYEVWRFNDSLHATNPVFLRLVYTQASSPTMFFVSAQIGTATDGAGNLASAAGTNVSVTSVFGMCTGGTAAPAATVGNYYVYGDGSSLIIASHPERMTATSAGYGGLLFLERARHLDGTPLGDAVVLYCAGGNNAASIYVQTVLLNNLYPQPGMGSGTGGWFPSGQGTMPASGVVGANMYTYPWFTGVSPRLGAPSTMIIGHIRTDMPAGNVFTCDHYGAPRTFVSIAPPSNAYVFQMASNQSSIYPALRTS